MQKIFGFGAERIEPLPGTPREELIARNRMMLARALNLRTTVAFVGSGCSAALGYPVWRTFTLAVVRSTIAAVGTCRGMAGADATLARLQRFETQLQCPGAIATRDLLFSIGICQSVAELLPSPANECYRNTIVEQFAARKPAAAVLNPYHALLDLPITRFVTSNYDTELEMALKEKRQVPLHELGLDPARPPSGRPKSFTQKPEFHDLAGVFAIAERALTRNLVFHCHGRIDDPSSIVATERDYQEWYLADRPAVASFRQSIDLLFGSNPVLFVGFGMEDDDLLRPLRMFHAARAERRHTRPLFALLPESVPGDADWQDQLFDRYGVHVIPYPKPSDAELARRPSAWGDRLHDELKALSEEWKSNMAEWFRKPVIRRVEVTATRPDLYRHYAPESDDAHVLAPQSMARDVARLEKDVKKGGVVVVTGEGGSGKSWRVLRMLDSVYSKGGFDGHFFWSSYYTDDWLTGLDRALRYLEKSPRASSRKRRLDRFVSQIRNGKHLLVFDGFERLLRETEPGIGKANNRGVTALLQAALSGKSTIVLTTRLMPDVLARAKKGVTKFAVAKHTTAELARGGIFAGLLGKHFTLDDLSALCSLCEGHSYALLLASGFLQRGPVDRQMVKLRHELARVAPNHRIGHVIEMVVKAVDDQTAGAACALLERLAIFMSPVPEHTLSLCYEAVQQEIPSAPPLADTLKALMDAHLVFTVSTKPRGREPRAHTVHPTVRGFVFERLHGAGSEMLPNFALAGFTSGNVVVWPGSARSIRQIHDLFDRLEGAVVKAPTQVLRRELCRSAFGIVRSRMEANTAARWCGYTNYLKFGIRSAMMVKSVSPALWDFAERTHASKLEHREGILYADELAWLYSDAGLALYSEGSMADTYAVWELSYEIDRVTDNEEESGQYIVQSRLHMAGVFIEQGRLNDADIFLNRCEQANLIYQDPDYDARVAGYRALLRHLRGDLNAADLLYAEAMKHSPGMRNLRSESIFQQHWADLKISMRDFGMARTYVERGLAAAREGRYDDLVAYARCTLGHLERAEGHYPAAQIQYKAALDAAHSQQIRRLEADVYSEMSRLALNLGDWETARSRAIASLMIANELSLGLRRTHGLVVLGLAASSSGHPQLGRAHLCHAHTLAIEQTYHLRAQEAERELRARGFDPPRNPASEFPK